jgi:hypothetical protein|tara:strand:+ start:967 stop:1191 length:225 start_codon:yes stop_codon:yes gene_type:complete
MEVDNLVCEHCSSAIDGQTKLGVVLKGNGIEEALPWEYALCEACLVIMTGDDDVRNIEGTVATINRKLSDLAEK